jgi:hypothetical protein
MGTLERSIESRGVRWVESLGHVAQKVGRTGWPDRIILLGQGRHLWWEAKTPTGTLTRAQVVVIEKLRKRGDIVAVGDENDLRRALNAYSW